MPTSQLVLNLVTDLSGGQWAWRDSKSNASTSGFRGGDIGSNDPSSINTRAAVFQDLLKHKLQSCPWIISHEPLNIVNQTITSTNSSTATYKSYRKLKKLGLHGDVYYEPAFLARMRVRLPLVLNLQRDSYAMREVLAYFTSLKMANVLVSVDSSSEDGIFNPVLLKRPNVVIQKNNLKSIGLGVIVGLSDYVSHWDTRFVDRGFTRTVQKKAIFNHAKSELEIAFFHHFNTEMGFIYKMKVRYDSIHSIYVVPYSENTGKGMSRALDVFLLLEHPPLLYEKETHSSTVEYESQEGIQRVPCFIQSFHLGRMNELEFGKCNVLHLSMDDKNFDQDPWIILSTLKFFLDGMKTPKPIYFSHIKFQRSETLKDQQLLKGLAANSLPDFLQKEKYESLFYAISCSVNYSHKFEDDLFLCPKEERDKFWRMVKEKWLEDGGSTEEVFYEIARAIMRCAFIRVIPAFNDLIETSWKRWKEESLYRKFCDSQFLEAGIQKIRRAVWTPTRLILFPPHPFVYSRVLKDTCDYRYALRTIIRDDDGRNINFNIGSGTEEQQKQFLANIKWRVIGGLKAGSRVYEYLATSNSQMREAGMILYARDSEGRDAKHCQREIGDLSGIRSVGKYIARMGQSFSQMMTSFEIEPEDIIPIEDIQGGRHPESGKPYNFTDGVGKMTKMFRDTVVLHLKKQGYLENGYIPSAVQFRCQGIKGIVVFDPYMKDGEGKYVSQNQPFLGIRASMDKFESTSNTFAVLKYSAPRSVFLNRQLINILDQMRTPRNVLHELLSRFLNVIYKSFMDNTQAAKMIKTISPQFHSMYYVDQLIQSGISILGEPFFRKVVDIVVHRNLRDLREKMRIPLEMNEARLMFGVDDPIGILEYGQVFIQYTDDKDHTKTRVHTGKVMVTKNPCMHPGDVRIFNAVDHPLLHHIKDCIVFPIKGPRPHPNEMAGSDLDGDEYVVIFRQDLFFPRENYEAMVFPDVHAEELPKGQEITIENILDFFCEHIRNNSIGLIANSHLALSDDFSIFYPTLMDLARKYSIALDFPKTGKNAVLHPDDRAKNYPDFMEKGQEKSTYKSNRVLGELYRKVCAFQTFSADSVENTEQSENPLLIHPDWQKYEEIAMIDFFLYASQMISILKETSVESEASLISVILSRDSRYGLGREDGTKRDTDVQDIITRVVYRQHEMWRKRFLELIPSDLNPKVRNEELMKKASAYYMVQYQLNREIAEQKKEGFSDITLKQPIYGFAWIAASELASLYRHMIGNQDSIALQIRNSAESVLQETIAQLHNFQRSSTALLVWLENHPLKKQVGMNFEVQDFEDLSRIVAQVNDEVSELENREAKVIIKILERLIQEWLPSSENNGRLAKAALLTLSRLFRQKNTDDFKEDVDMTDPDFEELRLRNYHISLKQPTWDRYYSRQFTDLVNNHPREVLRYLQDASKVKDITAIKQRIRKYEYWIIVAYGTQCQLELLHNIITERDFLVNTTEAVIQRMKARGVNSCATH